MAEVGFFFFKPYLKKIVQIPGLLFYKLSLFTDIHIDGDDAHNMKSSKTNPDRPWIH